MAKQVKPLVPVIDKVLGRNRPWFAGEDEHGPYVAVQLTAGRYQGEYFLISPQWRERVMLYACKIITGGNRNGSNNVGFGNGPETMLLSRYIWQDCLKRRPVPRVYSLRALLDLRDDALGVQRLCTTGLYGVDEGRSGFQACFKHNGQKLYLGFSKNKEDAARLFNNELRRRKLAESRKPPEARDWRIMYMTFNVVTPQFTPRDPAKRRLNLAALLAEPDDDSAAA